MPHKYGSNIPLARELLEDFVEQYPHHAAKIAPIVDLMRRRKPVRKNAPKKRGITDDVKTEVRRLAHATTLHNDEIATRVGVNPGRVSEILNESAP